MVTPGATWTETNLCGQTWHRAGLEVSWRLWGIWTGPVARLSLWAGELQVWPDWASWQMPAWTPCAWFPARRVKASDRSGSDDSATLICATVFSLLAKLLRQLSWRGSLPYLSVSPPVISQLWVLPHSWRFAHSTNTLWLTGQRDEKVTWVTDDSMNEPGEEM